MAGSSKHNKYISDGVATAVTAAIGDGNLEIHDNCSFLNSIVRFDKIEVRVAGDGSSFLNMDSLVDKDYILAWRADVGGVFAKDMRKKQYHLYSELVITGDFGENVVGPIKVLVRRIEPGDFVSALLSDDVASKNFSAIRLGDYDYIIIKVVTLNGGYSGEGILCEHIAELNDNRFETEYSQEPEDDDDGEPIYIDESIDTTYSFYDEEND